MNTDSPNRIVAEHHRPRPTMVRSHGVDVYVTPARACWCGQPSNGYNGPTDGTHATEVCADHGGFDYHPWTSGRR